MEGSCIPSPCGGGDTGGKVSTQQGFSRADFTTWGEQFFLPLPVFRPEGADGGAGLPQLEVVHLLQLGVELLPVVGGVVHRKDDPRLLPGVDALVELVEDRGDGLPEGALPVEGAPLGGGAAVGVHPVHAVFRDEPDEALGQLLDRFVEGLARAVAVLPQDVVLRLHDAGQAPHQDAPLAGQVAEHLLLEGRREEVARADGDAEGEGLLRRLSRIVLEDREARVDAASVEEVGAERAARSLRGDEDHVDVRRAG